MCNRLFMRFLGGGVALLASTNALAFPWAETLYSVTVVPNQIAYYPGFTASTTATYQWSFGVSNWHRVTGSSSSEPSWRSEFAVLMNSTWIQHSGTFRASIPAGYTVSNKEVYETTTGTNTFVSGSNSASRSLDKKVSTALTYVVTGPGETPPGGWPPGNGD